MKKKALDENVMTIKTETHDALALLYNALPPGQQKTVLKNKAVRELLLRYHVIEEGKE